MLIKELNFKEILVDKGFMSQEEFALAEQQARAEDLDLADVLVAENTNVGQLIAEELGCKFVVLSNEVIAPEIINTVPELVARNQNVIVFDKTKDGLKVAMSDPKNFEMIDWLERKTGEKAQIYYTTCFEIRAALKYYRKELSKAFEDIIGEQISAAKASQVKAEDAPIIKILDTIIDYGYQNCASDIHLEPAGKKAQVRFRIDGMLHSVLYLPKNIHNLIITRIKVLSAMRTDEHLAAQDGKFTGASGKEKFDLRASIVPCTTGETAVIRILSEGARRYTFDVLGMTGRDLEIVNAAITKPYGMILVTGPTGCGKTTTLYAILKILKKPEVNICTIEDPVEYDIDGVTQIQVNAKTNLTFANGLRSIVRQDPNIIMVGEIRDPETASIAVNSAMTGHLVLSTMHANTAATNLPRLTDMGVEPFLVASSVNVIVAQRLVRKICSKCRESVEMSKEGILKLGGSEEIAAKLCGGKAKVRIYRGRGCKDCVNTGYVGRVGIFEVMEMKENVGRLVMSKADTVQIQEAAIQNGMTSMFEDGLRKVLAGVTTLEEVIRAIKI